MIKGDKSSKKKKKVTKKKKITKKKKTKRSLRPRSPAKRRLGEYYTYEEDKER